MRAQVIAEATTWLNETSASWSDDFAQGVEKSLLGFLEVDADCVVEKVNEDKLAHDVEDLSAIFEQLEEGNVDFSLPCDDEDVADEDQGDDWIEDLDRDVVNVEELSAAFEMLAEQEEADADMEDDDIETQGKSDSDDDSENWSEEDEDDDAVRVVPAAPTWVCGPPLDPRSVIRTTIFKNLDPRIPMVKIPRMDLAVGSASSPVAKSASTKTPAAPMLPVFSATLPAKTCAEKKTNDCDEAPYVHDPATCWICKSDKSAYKKFALHRYLEKRRRRNWKRGPRYSGRSHVATNRVREGGRFVCTARWI